jgi:hypothetical protein
LDENFSRPITTFDEVPPLIAWLDDQGVDLKRETAEVSSDRISPLTGARSTGTPPSTFLFLPIHLSNSPGPSGPLSAERRATQHTAVEAYGFRSGSEPGHRISMRSFEDAPSRRGGGVPNSGII